jgi:hypothetical protein
MTIDKIGYSETFQVSESNWRKLWFEAELSPGDDPEAEIFLLKEKIDIIKKKMGELKTVPISEVLPVETKESKIDGIAEAIKSCTTLIALERFRPMVERENVDVLYEAYHNKKNELNDA